jgi:hypothetical protein
LSLTDIRQIRRFGVVALIFFGVLASLGIWTKRPVPTCVFGALSLLGLGFILLPEQLRPVHDAWLKIAHLVGRVVTTTILALAYYLVITPSALIKRVFGGRPLPMRPDEKAPSYWVTRSEPVQPRDRFLKRY